MRKRKWGKPRRYAEKGRVLNNTLNQKLDNY